MEGPSLFLAEEQLKPFCGKKILEVTGNTSLPKERFLGEEVVTIFSWGKHLVFQFKTYGFRVHFLLFGTFVATVNEKSVTGDYKKSQTPRLSLVFENGHIEMYSCSIKIVEESHIHDSYDFTASIMSSQWSTAKALKKIKLSAHEQIGDVLLDQEIFAGVGNIIKNEVLWLVKINPKTVVSELSDKELKKCINETYAFSHQFYEWRKVFMLKKNLQVYRKKVCARCSGEVIREKTGKRARWSYYCSFCQNPK